MKNINKTIAVKKPRVQTAVGTRDKSAPRGKLGYGNVLNRN